MTKKPFIYLIIAALVLINQSCNLFSQVPASQSPNSTTGQQPTNTPVTAGQGAQNTPAVGGTQAGQIQPTAASGGTIPVLSFPAPTGDATKAATELADKLAAATSIAEMYPVVVQILAWGGIPVYDANGKLIMPPAGPASDLRLFDFQAYGLAVDAFEHGGSTLADMDQALEDIDTKVGDLPISDDLMEQFLSDWVSKAGTAQPSDWQVFVPSYLKESALDKPVAIDITYSGYDAADLQFFYLDWALFFGAHVRNGAPVPPSLAFTGAVGHLNEPVRDNLCTMYQNALKSMGDWVSGGINENDGDLLGETWQELAKDVGGAIGTGMKWGAKGLGWAMSLISSIASNNAWQITMTPDPNPAHYRTDEPDDVYSYFRVKVELNPSWPAWFGDCMKSIGMELPDEQTLNDAKIHWVPISGTPTHATVMEEGLSGGWTSKLDGNHEAKIKLKMSTEKDEAWKTAPIKYGHIQMKAELYRDNGFPGPMTWVNAAVGDIPAALVAPLKGWYDKWFPMKTYEVMQVEYHQVVPMTFMRKTTVQGVETTFSGYNCKGLYGNWIMNETMNGTIQGVQITGSGDYTGQVEQESDGDFSGSLDIQIVLAGAPVNSNITVQSGGSLKIVGTQEVPVLQIQEQKGTGSGSGTGPGESFTIPSTLSGPGGSPVGIALHEDPDYPQCNK